MIIKEIVAVIIFIPLMFAWVLVSQSNLSPYINDDNFKKIKIKRFKFMFRAIDRQSVEKHGIIKSLLFVQIFVYVFMLLSTIATTVLLFVLKTENNLRIVLFVLSVSAGGMILTTVLVIAITQIISKKREKKKCQVYYQDGINETKKRK
jgi:hypothetical protein